MATTNFTTRDDEHGDLAGQGEAWTAIVVGERTTASFVEVRSGTIEYADETSAPSTGLFGHILSKESDAKGGESQNFALVAAGTTVYARAVSDDATLVVSPGTAA